MSETHVIAESNITTSIDLNQIEEKYDTVLETQTTKQQNESSITVQPFHTESDTIDNQNVSYAPQQYTLLESEKDLSKPLPKPHKGGLYNTIKYHGESFLVVHPRILALFLLYKSTWPRALVIFDMYTDVIVALGLYKGEHKIWFMLSCLFIAFPFVLVWAASLRFLQNDIQALYSNLKTQNVKGKSIIHGVLNMILLVYIFPPIGAIFIAVYEVYWIISDIFNGFKSFIFGTGLIIAEDQQTKAMKSYRRAIEIFSESIPQTVLQLYIFINLKLKGVESGIDPNDLYMSLAVSVLNLCINFHRFKSEANLHGMSWSEYALSVLQLAEIPINKLVPRLPAIRKGLIESVNFSGFVFDKESLSPLLEAVNSPKCQLKMLRLSIGSLSQLDMQSCWMLGSLLYNANINVLISRTSSLLDIKRLFDSIDEDNDGYLDEREFLSALKKLNSSIKNSSLRQQQRVFQKLAIRRVKERDRVYFYDFFLNTASVQREKNSQINFDITQIDLPVHFIFQRIQQAISNISESDDTTKRSENTIINNMKQLFEFCNAMNMLNQVDQSNGNHVFYPVVDALVSLIFNKLLDIRIEKYRELIWYFLRKLLESKQIGASLLSKRNIVNKDLKVIDGSLLHKILSASKGVNIFEYCFVQTDYYANYANCGALCKVVAFLLNKYLGDMNKQQWNALIKPSGPLYEVFCHTHGFHITDNERKTVLQYVIEYNLKQSFEFYANYIMTRSDVWSWVDDQDYLHSLMQRADSELLQYLLSLKSMDVNYSSLQNACIARKLLQGRVVTDEILKCFDILVEFDYNFEAIQDSTGKNVLHYISDHPDIVEGTLIDKIVDIYKSKSHSISSLLNHVDRQGNTPLLSAISLGKGRIAMSLFKCKDIIFDVEKSINSWSTNLDWDAIKCFDEILTVDKGFLKRFEREDTIKLYDFMLTLSETIPSRSKSVEYQYVNRILSSLETYSEIVNYLKTEKLKIKRNPMRDTKCVVVGDQSTCKTALLVTYKECAFPGEYIPTVFDNYTKDVMIDGHWIRIGLWDTAGQEEYSCRSVSYPHTDVFVVLFSVDSPRSLANACTKWIPEIQHHSPTTPYILVGNKIHLRDEDVSTISREEGITTAKECGASAYVECSAPQYRGIQEVFDIAIKVALHSNYKFYAAKT
eukprot:230297_1